MLARNLSPSRLRRLLSPFSPNAYLGGADPFHCSLQSVVIEHSSPFSQNLGKPPIAARRFFSSVDVKNPVLSDFSVTRDGNFEETAEKAFSFCPGCGIQMQNLDPKQPGFFTEPSLKAPNYKKFKKMIPVSDESEVSDFLKKGLASEIVGDVSLEKVEGEDGVFDNIPQCEDEKLATQKPIVCSRCHSLRHYQKVKDPSVEKLLPDFDFEYTVGRRMTLIDGARTVVLLLADVADFDGSFPGRAASGVFKTIDENSRSWKEGKSGNVPRILLVVTKIDLLPISISPTTLEHWVRRRAREAGAGKITSVHLVSALKGWGVKTLLDCAVKLSGKRGNVWAVGAQNAGKSTLLNALSKCAGMKETHLTESSIPGTTLGILRMEGILPWKIKLFDTPGLLHPHQISTRLTTSEQKLIRIDKMLKPRTYRIKAGHSIHVAGLARFDLEDCAVDSIYVTVWASPLIPLHLGKTENAKTMIEEHFGRQLQPPIGDARVKEMGKWVKKDICVSGDTWDSSSVDISVAGLGWFALGLKREAKVGVWTYEGVDVVARNPLLPQRSSNFEVSGFTVNEIVSKADRATVFKMKKTKTNIPVEASLFEQTPDSDSDLDQSSLPTSSPS